MSSPFEYYEKATSSPKALAVLMAPNRQTPPRPDDQNRDYLHYMTKLSLWAMLIEIFGLWIWWITSDTQAFYLSPQHSLFIIALWTIPLFSLIRTIKDYQVYKNAYNQTEEKRNNFLWGVYGTITITIAILMINLSQHLVALQANAAAQIAIPVVFVSGAFFLTIRQIYNIIVLNQKMRKLNKNNPKDAEQIAAYKGKIWSYHAPFALLLGSYVFIVSILFIAPNVLNFIHGGPAPTPAEAGVPTWLTIFAATWIITILTAYILKDGKNTFLSKRRQHFSPYNMADKIEAPKAELPKTYVNGVLNYDELATSISDDRTKLGYYNRALFAQSIRTIDLTSRAPLINQRIDRIKNEFTNQNDPRHTLLASLEAIMADPESNFFKDLNNPEDDELDTRLNRFQESLTQKLKTQPDLRSSNGIRAIQAVLQNEIWTPDEKALAIDRIVANKKHHNPFSRSSAAERFYAEYQPFTARDYVTAELAKKVEQAGPGCLTDSAPDHIFGWSAGLFGQGGREVSAIQDLLYAVQDYLIDLKEAPQAAPELDNTAV